MKSLWVEIRIGRSLTSYRHGKNRLDMGKMNLIYCQLVTEKDREK